MAGLITELLLVLDEEQAIYEQFLALGKSKKDAIVQNDIEALKTVTAQENGLAGKVSRIERKRIPLLNDIAEVMAVKPETLTLAFLVKSLNGQPEADTLNKRMFELRKTVDELKRQNEQNKILLQESLDYIEFSMNVIRGSLSDSPSVFSARGEELNGSGFLDIRN